MKTTSNKQPQITQDLQLLHVGYDHMDLLLDLYGTRDEDGYCVETVALTGQKIDLCELFSGCQLEQMGTWCDDNLASARVLRLVSAQEARAERVSWERDYCAA